MGRRTEETFSPRKPRWEEILGEQVIRVSGAASRSRGRFLVHFGFGLTMAVLSALFSSWVHIQNVNVRYEVSQRLLVQRDFIQARDKLEIERQMLRSPQRITRLAQERFGMRLPAGEEQVVVVK